VSPERSQDSLAQRRALAQRDSDAPSERVTRGSIGSGQPRAQGLVK
jgi:hypothetical protein